MSSISRGRLSESDPYCPDKGLAFERRGGGDADESRNGEPDPAEIPSPTAARFLG